MPDRDPYVMNINQLKTLLHLSPSCAPLSEQSADASRQHQEARGRSRGNDDEKALPPTPPSDVGGKGELCKSIRKCEEFRPSSLSSSF